MAGHWRDVCLSVCLCLFVCVSVCLYVCVQVVAYVMKANGWSLDRSLAYVQRRRPCVKPNQGFLKQLFEYEGILNAKLAATEHIFIVYSLSRIVVTNIMTMMFLHSVRVMIHHFGFVIHLIGLCHPVCLILCSHVKYSSLIFYV